MQHRDPLHDDKAELPDFVYRLRRMGYPGNVRVEFPVWTPEDVKWAATIVGDAARQLSDLIQIKECPPLVRVLRARAFLVQMDHELKLRTTHKAAKRLMKAHPENYEWKDGT